MSVNTPLRIAAVFFAVVMLGPDQHPQFALDDTVVFLRVFNDSFAQSDVFFEREMTAVDHDAGKTLVDTFLAQIERITVIEMHCDRDVGKADSRFDEFLEINGVGVLARALGNLEHDRSFFLLAGLDNGLEQLHVVHVEGADGVFAFECFDEEFSGVCQWHN